MPVTATIYPCHGEHFHGITARIALEEGKLRKLRKVNRFTVTSPTHRLHRSHHLF